MKVQVDGELEELAKLLPNHLIIEKVLWVGNVRVDIDHIDDDLYKPLDYVKSFRKMIKRLESRG